ncbi:MAG: hypothetical protein ABIO92_00600 [Chloroflexia bacterium]
MLDRARDIISRRLLAKLEQNGSLSALLDDLSTHKIDPATAARQLVDESRSV